MRTGLQITNHWYNNKLYWKCKWITKQTNAWYETSTPSNDPRNSQLILPESYIQHQQILIVLDMKFWLTVTKRLTKTLIWMKKLQGFKIGKKIDTRILNSFTLRSLIKGWRLFFQGFFVKIILFFHGKHQFFKKLLIYLTITAHG